MFTNLCVFSNVALLNSPVGTIWTHKGILTCVCQHMSVNMTLHRCLIVTFRTFKRITGMFLHMKIQTKKGDLWTKTILHAVWGWVIKS